MPNSPSIRFNFKNDNVQASTPLLGVSHVLARTTKGKFNDPSILIRNIGQFRDIFGEEIVPDGSVSNIEKALELGSMLRICRVAGAGTAQGEAETAILTTGKWITDGTSVNTLILTISGAGLAADVTVELGFKTREMGSPLGGQENKFLLKLSQVGPTVTASVYNSVYDNMLTTNYLIDSMPFIKYIDGSSTVNSFIDASLLEAFIKNNRYLEVSLLSSTDTGITNLDQLVEFLKLHQGTSDGALEISDGTLTLGSTQDLIYVGTEGNPGAVPTAAEWVASLDYLKDFSNEAYQIFCSHLNGHLSTVADAETVNIAIGNYVNSANELVYYIDVPKFDTDGSPMTDTDINSWVSSMVSKVGYSKYVCYFAGGLKYYNSKGDLKDVDNLGTVIGLGDASATSFGPWYHFSGINRGIVLNARGIVSPNYGVPSKYPQLNVLANNYVNIFVIKDTASFGKQVVLWHNFTSQIKDDSNKFLGVVRLNLYLKKNLRPVIEGMIEEPNTFSTWNRLYHLVKPLLDDVQERKGITEWNWYGDQDATSYADLQINTEADVRAGKYKAKLVYKEVVALQEVTMDLIIDAAAGTVSIQ